MQEDIVVPVALFIMLSVIFGLWFMFRYRTRTELQRTVRAALDKGQELTPELIERLGQPRQTPYTDLRKALIWIAVGLGFMVAAFVFDWGMVDQSLLGVGAFPLLIGVAYLVMSRFGERDTSS
ncbi:MAG TPA: DUF6249 domain-containing protein [Woeseiaceae bacterium]|nr:DUF6249 domain-containing protein [Woeseiaceae bacterium]